jgi:DNA-binding LacI/PurR family transcriptional regulator
MSVRKIAAALGLSPSTVSLSLRDSRKIPAATRRRVIAYARRIGYGPNARLTQAMAQLRLARTAPQQACFGVISFYDTIAPWNKSIHHARIYESMQRRASELGYRLEALHLRATGMTPARFRAILDARGIQGLLCFGSPNVNEIFPPDFDACAVVTIGLSIDTPLHRVTAHFYNDLTHVLQKLVARGYRRPGLVLGRYEDHRSAHAYIGAYLAWCEHHLGHNVAPILRLDQVEETPLIEWIRGHDLDVVVLVHLYDVLMEFQRVLRKHGIRVPHDIGVAAVSQILQGTGLAGSEQDQALIGAWAVELLVARIMNEDFGIPAIPRIEMVESHWVEGASLRPSLVQAPTFPCLPAVT